MMDGWKYYNHAMIPTTAPHENVETTDIETGNVWKQCSRALLARWTTNWDCGYETNWWYVIKDEPFDIMCLDSKRRYEINKGRRFFAVKEFKLNDYLDAIADIYEASYGSYSNNSRPIFNREKFINSHTPQNDSTKYYGAFEMESGKLCAFCYLSFDGKYANYVSHKAFPEYEKKAVNAALVAGMLDLNKDFLSYGGYICDGARSISHETHFQDYLEKYFGFRKAFCKLCVAYRPIVALFVNGIYRFRNTIYKLDQSGSLFHSITVLLKQEELLRIEKSTKGDFYG